MRFCFILGSGASVQSGVPTGQRLVNEWLRTLFGHQCPGQKEDAMPAWAADAFADIPGFTWERRADFYGYIYSRRFPDNASGQAWLRQLMNRKIPSFGYSVLARILSDTRHNLVITTNFDNLVHEALTAHGQPRAFIAHSPGDARFIPNHEDKPRILKLHGDIDRETYNAAALIHELKDDWVQPLQHLLGAYTPVFLGYGGCDPGLMRFLNNIYQPSDARVRPIWAYRVNVEALPMAKDPAANPPGRPDTNFATEFAGKHGAWWLPTPGFDELMVLLAHALSIPHAGKEIAATAERLRDDYQKNLTDALKNARSADGSKWCPQLDAMTRLAEEHLIGASDTRRWPEWQEYIESAVTPEEKISRCREAVAKLPDDPRVFALLSDAVFSKNPSDPEAKLVLELAITMGIRQFGPDSEELLFVRRAAASQKSRSGRPTEAEPELREIVKQLTLLLGTDSPQTLRARNMLASCLNQQGKAAEAEAEHRAVLEIRERVLGPEHRDTLSTRNNLAIALLAQGQAAAAEVELRGLLEVQVKLFGADHPDLLISRGNLANALRALGKYADAEEECRLVLALCERVFGTEHPFTLTSRNNLAALLDDQGKFAEAEAEHRAVLAGRQRILGSEDPDTLCSRNNLAEALRAQGKDEEAEVEHRCVLALRERVLGLEHADTLASRIHLANALQSRGKASEAEAQYRAVFAVQEQVLGPEHPETLGCRNNLATALWAQRKNREAEAEHRAVLAVMKRVLGPEHPDTLKSRNNLAAAFRVQGKHAKAEVEHRAVLDLQERVLGLEHPHSSRSHYNLALCLGDQKKLEEGKREAGAAYAGYRKMLGEEHPRTVAAKELVEKLEGMK